MVFKIKKDYGERVAKVLIDRVRPLVSIEFALSLLIMFLLLQVQAVERWVYQSLSMSELLTETDDMIDIIEQVNNHRNMEYLRFIAVFFSVIFVVYAAGEIIRRKLKLKSLWFKNYESEK